MFKTVFQQYDIFNQQNVTELLVSYSKFVLVKKYVPHRLRILEKIEQQLVPFDIIKIQWTISYLRTQWTYHSRY